MGNKSQRVQILEDWAIANAASRHQYEFFDIQDIICDDSEQEDGQFVLVKKKSSRLTSKRYEIPVTVIPLSLEEAVEELTASRAVTYLEDAQFPFSDRWDDVARRLDVPQEERKKQRMSIATDMDYKRALEACLEYWKQNNAEATWPVLLGIVEKYASATAEKLRKKLGLYSEDVMMRLRKQCDERLICQLNICLDGSRHYETLAPYFLSSSEIEVIEQHPEDLRMLKMLQNWRDCWDEKATYEALVCILRKAHKCQPDIINLVMSHLESPSFDLLNEDTQEFSALSSDEISVLKQEFKKIQRQFSDLVSSTASSLVNSGNTDFQSMKYYIVSRCSNQERYCRAQDIVELMDALVTGVSWINFEILEEVIIKYGDEEHKHSLKEYREMLYRYLDKSILKLPTTATSDKNRDAKVYLKIPDNDSTLPDVKGLDVLHVKDKIGEHIQVPGHKIKFVQYRLGCIEVVFSVACKKDMSNVEWDEQRHEYKVTGELPTFLPADFFTRNSMLSSSSFHEITEHKTSLENDDVENCDATSDLSFSFKHRSSEH